MLLSIDLKEGEKTFFLSILSNLKFVNEVKVVSSESLATDLLAALKKAKDIEPNKVKPISIANFLEELESLHS